MAYITWETKSGSLGAIAQSQYYEFPLTAKDSAGAAVVYTCIAGELPLGMRVSLDGIVKGVPVIQSTASKSVTSLFSVRASTAAGQIADRSFSITVNNFSSVKINADTTVLGTFDDGAYLSYQFSASSDNPNTVLLWSIITGETPIDAVTGLQIGISTGGLLSGYLGRLVNTGPESFLEGYDNNAADEMPYDFTPIVHDRSYTFTVMVTDGSSFDTSTVNINVVSKRQFTADNAITLSNNTFITIDQDTSYPPIILTKVDNMPVLTVGDNFTFKFDALDPIRGTAGPILWATSAGILDCGLTISNVTGWLSGTIPPQSETQKEYTFDIYAYQSDYPEVRSIALPVTITTVKDSINFVTWLTDANLGTMVNGFTSEYVIEAVNNAGKDLTYSQVSGRLPIGLSLMSNGEIVGRNGFRYFSIDNHSATITVDSTTDIIPGMTVQGPGVASGCQVVKVTPPNTVKIEPSTFITEGSAITFTDLVNHVNVTKQLTSLSSTTMIDGNRTTFDSTYNFTVKAITDDNTVTATKLFTIKIDNYNRAPYENIWLHALMLKEQRDIFASIITNTDIFPPESIYRADDLNFGLASTLKMLLLPGVTVSELSTVALAIQKNHYNKTIKFGDVKTARAMDENFNVKYEVVYLEVGDNKESHGVSAALIQEPNVAPYLYEDQQFTTVYPNSFANMKYRLGTGVGYANRGALPRWMTSRQEDGTELGLVRAIVLAYTLPGESKKIAYRLKDSNIAFNSLHFVSDRYFIDSSYVADYNPTTNNFFSGAVDATDKYIHYPQYGVYR